MIALSEFPERDLSTRRDAVAPKSWVCGQFETLTERLAETAPTSDPAALADQIFLVMEGVYATVQAFGPTGPAHRAGALVASLLLPQ